MNLEQKYQNAVDHLNSLLSVGLDPHFDQLPDRFKSLKRPQFEFNKWIIDQTKDYVSVFKPQFAAYEARGSDGWRELEMTMEYIHEHYPDHFTIADAKRGDIGSTNEEYARAIFDRLGFDAVTLHPYLGKEALEPFLAREDKGSIILCRTSNPGAGEFQDLVVVSNTQDLKARSKLGVIEEVGPLRRGPTSKLWEVVAERVSRDWNERGNCMLVVGATYPEELGRVREIVGEMTLLVPGIGAQGGDLEAVMRNGMKSKKAGLIIHASRSIIFASDPALEARKLRDEINGWKNYESD